MHIPDGFLSARVAAGSGLLALLGLSAACARIRRTREQAKSALLGVCAAFAFAAQLVNFPIAAGTSGHLVGGALCALLLGLPAAVVAMSAVLIVQCLVFADGGLLALGANLTNLALLGPSVGYAAYRLACGQRPSHTRRVAASAFAGFCAVMASAAGCAEQLALSGTAPLATIFPALVGVHVLVASGEAVITALVVATVLRLRPELLERRDLPAAGSFSRASLGYGLSLASIVAILLAPVASAAPDALGRVATRLGFSAQHGPTLPAPLSDYHMPGLGGGLFAVAMAGAVGTLALFGLCWLLALALAPRRRAPAPPAVSACESSG